MAICLSDARPPVELKLKAESRERKAAVYTHSMSARWLSVLCLVAALTVASACGDPPEKEMQQAQGAIDAARAAGADEYAHEEFTAAQEALKHAREAVDQHDYRLALNHALDSRERAQSAAKQAGDHKATARADADRALINVSAALGDARLKLKAAESSHIPSARLGDARAAIANGEQAVQEARAAFGRGEYLSVAGTVSGATTRLRGVARDLEAMVASTAHRRR